jgi:hypothetical protein
MSSTLDDKAGDTVRLSRPAPRIFTDVTGRNVWMGAVEVLELELVQSDETDPYNNASRGEIYSKA